MYTHGGNNNIHHIIEVEIYSRASEQRTLWERAFCPLFGGCPYLGGLPLFDYGIFH